MLFAMNKALTRSGYEGALIWVVVLIMVAVSLMTLIGSRNHSQPQLESGPFFTLVASRRSRSVWLLTRSSTVALVTAILLIVSVIPPSSPPLLLTTGATFLGFVASLGACSLLLLFDPSQTSPREGRAFIPATSNSVLTDGGFGPVWLWLARWHWMRRAGRVAIIAWSAAIMLFGAAVAALARSNGGEEIGAIVLSGACLLAGVVGCSSHSGLAILLGHEALSLGRLWSIILLPRLAIFSVLVLLIGPITGHAVQMWLPAASGAIALVFAWTTLQWLHVLKSSRSLADLFTMIDALVIVVVASFTGPFVLAWVGGRGVQLLFAARRSRWLDK